MRNYFLQYFNHLIINKHLPNFPTMVHVVTHNGNNGNTHGSLYCNLKNFKISLKNVSKNVVTLKHCMYYTKPI